jgi:hypothetical protein
MVSGASFEDHRQGKGGGSGGRWSQPSWSAQVFQKGSWTGKKMLAGRHRAYPALMLSENGPTRMQ